MKHCGFPSSDHDWKNVNHRVPCDYDAVDTVEIDVSDTGRAGAILIVPLCEYHFYVMAKMFQRDITELVKNNQLRGELK